MKLREHAYDWLAWLLIGAVPLLIFWQNATSLTEQSVASGGPMSNAAAYPAIIAWILLGLTAVNALRIVAGRISQHSPLDPTPTTRLAMIATALFVAYLLCLGWLGYYIATPVLLTLLFAMLGLGPIASLAGAIAATLIVAAVFEGLLNVVLPLGIFNFTLFG
ncbi:tripartite tricarboxylate transporter TctB family protein [Salipiger abyssi]|uniref:tripartite tricarboxylate transporter TctB family protein n=1 Tax=Salipiger abyssi TaxID=1250539 RepID=UPI001A8E9AFF|nr:tripartite tricarboxylate transporter TctB family protein [Salipiger abyssi]MBN9887044.1 tripartite tricarboxylate transporter TctB family protein [Salipiger abyssi]